jgi:hypothetical protein
MDAAAMNDIHSCTYYCKKPACFKAQRCEMRDAMFDQQTVAPQRTYEQGLEDAAKVCDLLIPIDNRVPAIAATRECAAAIRALKGTKGWREHDTKHEF